MYGYNNQPYQAYAPYYAQPMPDQLAQLRQNPMMQQPQQMQQQCAGIIWVQGEAAAKSHPVANGATVTLWDSEQPTIYIKHVDESGMPSMRIVDYTERSQAARMPQNAMNVPAQEYVTREEFAALVARVDEYGANKTKKKESEEVENG